MVTAPCARFQCLPEKFVDVEKSRGTHALVDTIFADKQLPLGSSNVCSAKLSSKNVSHSYLRLQCVGCTVEGLRVEVIDRDGIVKSSR
jgi:hypothetical protein